MKRFVLVAAILGAIFGLTVSVYDQVYAASSDWMTVENIEVSDAGESLRVPVRYGIDGCTNRYVEVEGLTGASGPQQMCVRDTTTYSIGYLTSPDHPRYPFISLDGEVFGGLYNEGNLNTYTIRPGGNELIMRVSHGEVPFTRVYDMSNVRLTKLYPGHGSGRGSIYWPSGGFEFLYEMDILDSRHLLSRSNLIHGGSPMPYLSRNGGYGVIDDSGPVAVVDLNSHGFLNRYTYKTRIVSAESMGGVSVYRAWPNAKIVENAVSDSGRVVASVSNLSEVWVYGVSGSCGVINVPSWVESSWIEKDDVNWCEKIDLTSMVRQYLMDEVGYVSMSQPAPPQFIDEYTLLVGNFDLGNDRVGALKLSIDPGEPEHLLEYLALGDSYSSGEGDIGRKTDGGSYYLPGTEGDEQCHLSTRSYPLLLKERWGIGNGAMQSVACSGAQLLPDYLGRSEGYLGQNGRLKYDGDIANTQQQSLISFKPGNVPQIEFIRRYKPRIITLTGGGNDVGFERVLRECVLPSVGDWFSAPISDCSYARKGSGANQALLNAIDMQYGVTKMFVEEVKSISPHSKVIIVGYPSFIADGPGIPVKCQLEGGILSASERKSLNEMTARLNGILQRVAYGAKVSYVDIEQSLVGGRLCDVSSKYMTGVRDYLSGRATEYEIFHPNADGHNSIANAIEKSGVYSSASIPGRGKVEPRADFKQTIRGDLVDDGVVVKSLTTFLKLVVGHFMPHSEYTVTIYSDPHQLGVFNANPDGSIDQQISFDGVEPGHHMLVVEGTGSDGEPLMIYQFVEVHTSVDDADGDGIPNSLDTCNFMPYIYDEDGNDLCEVGAAANHGSLNTQSPGGYNAGSLGDRGAGVESSLGRSLNVSDSSEDRLGVRGDSIHGTSELTVVEYRADVVWSDGRAIIEKVVVWVTILAAIVVSVCIIVVRRRKHATNK